MKVQFQKGATVLVDVLLTVGIVLFIISLFNSSKLVFVMACFIITLGLYPRVYLKLAVQAFSYDNSRKKLTLTNGDSGELVFNFVNKGNLPIMGVCRFAHDAVFQLEQANPSPVNRFQFVFSVRRQQSLEVRLPLLAVSRGIGHLQDFTILLSDPLKLLTIRLRSDFIRQEIVVYPKRQPLSGLESAILLQEGPHPNRNSLFFDRSLPIGTRHYIQGDSLKGIHWKATARMGSLQTKLIEKTMGLTWTFVVLIGSNMQKENVELLEDQLSSFARLAELAHNRGIDFDLIINTKPMGKALIWHTSQGNDRPHLFRIMERLAMIQVNFLRVDPKLAIREMTRSIVQPRVIFFAGAYKEILTDPILAHWVKKGHQLYQVGEAGTISPMLKRGGRRAN